MNPLTEKIQLDTRRHFLRNCGMGLGAGALANLLSPEAFALKGTTESIASPPTPFFRKGKACHLYTFNRIAPTLGYVGLQT
jgi:hypothetical protein